MDGSPDPGNPGRVGRALRAARSPQGALAGALVAVVVAGGLAMTVLADDGGPRDAGDLATSVTSGPGRPSLVALATEATWTVEVGSRRVSLVPHDPAASAAPTRALGGDDEVAAAVAADGGDALVVALARRAGGGGRAVRMTAAGRPRALVALDVAPRRLAVLPGAVVALGDTRVEWAGRRGGGRWLRGIGDGVDVAVGYGSAWTVSRGGAGSLVERWSPEGRRVGRRAVDGAATAIAVGRGAVWIANGCAGGIVRAPVGRGPGRCVRVGASVSHVVVGARGVWAIDDARRLVRLDPGTGAPVASVRLPVRPVALAAASDRVAVLGGAGRIVSVGVPPGGLRGTRLGPSIPPLPSAHTPRGPWRPAL